MDHLDIPDGADPLLIPLCTNDYDGDDFFGYPERQGWSERDGVIDFSDKHSQSAHIEAFLQNWLYFGCLLSILKLVGIEASCSDFIRTTPEGKQVVTTKSLAGFLVEWKKKEDFDHQLDLYEAKHGSQDYLWPGEQHRRLGGRRDRGKTIVAILNKVAEYADVYCANAVTDPDLTSQSPLSTKTAFSIMFLLKELCSTAEELYPTEKKFKHPSTKSIKSRWHRWVTERMVKSGWCPLELEALLSDCDINIQYYFAFLPSPRWGMDHSACDRNACRRKHIKNVAYSTKHREGCNTCEMVTVSDKMSSIVSKDKTPLLSWRKLEGSEDFKLEVVEYDPSSRENYVAISHVWSDGMGNETANSLPRCQLTNIQNMVNRLYARKRKENHLISVIGPTNPFIKSSESNSKQKESMPNSPQSVNRFWMDTLCVPVDKYDLRKMAISRMRTIYTEAHRILVLDSWIRSLCRTASQNEIGACLFLSNWQSRLWTFHEGLLARNLFFQFKDGPTSISDLKRNSAKEHKGNDGKVVRKFGSKLLGRIPMFDFNLGNPTMKNWTTKKERLFHYIKPLRSRSTTNKADETLCLATLLDINPEPLLSIKKKPKALRNDWTNEQEESEDERIYEERMALFLWMVGDLGPTIIFNALPRLSVRGFQWAPRTFIGNKTDGPSIYQEAEHLWLRFPHLSGGKVLRSGGILVTTPGARLEILEIPNSSDVISTLVASLREAGSTRYCVIKPGMGESAEFPPWQASAQYRILCEAPINSGEEIKAAILVMVDDSTTKTDEEGGWLKVIHICRIKISFVDAVTLTSGDGHVILARFLDVVKKRNWCVL
ncbi:hypothetical protein B0O99DRAFT_748013 [Bisporella sp. PMI_857]|nr:hypothetical protein B0O99DRAFT_748013 [Bisporella sp. PMI_857]